MRERSAKVSTLDQSLWTSFACLLLTLGCASAPPASPTGPTAAERVAHQEGYLDGQKAQAQRAQAELDAKDAEIAGLESELEKLRDDEARHAEAATSLQDCETSRDAEQARTAGLQNALDDQVRADEVARAKALGPKGRRRELADCYAQTLFCDTILSAFLEAASSPEERTALVNLGASGQESVGHSSRAPARTDRQPDPEAPEPQSCCKICHKGQACGDSCISRAYTCHKGPGCACDG